MKNEAKGITKIWSDKMLNYTTTLGNAVIAYAIEYSVYPVAVSPAHTVFISWILSFDVYINIFLHVGSCINATSFIVGRVSIVTPDWIMYIWNEK